MTRQRQRRQRSFQLTPTEWLTIEQARREQVVLDTPGDKYTLETLSAKTGLDRRTVAKVLDRKVGVDKRTLEQFFRAFNLELEPRDYARSDSDFELAQGSCRSRHRHSLESLQDASTHTRKDLRSCVDVSIFYGRTEELAQLQQWLLNDHCWLVAILGIGGIGKTGLSVRCAEQLGNQF